ncbi:MULTISPECIES: carbohydrate ABC transporter permease [unclassified Microbacterium]|uniref:carbohydrate ABC transporter permease n=1 Tax=unclassified Microbacterium TaxID=2609290 RepID=UPI0006F8803E|nr:MULTISPECIES: sugar ABC transporter permease [unclassified Microbacterium]KQP68481.1 sugar ABC transporter permease [Microbacterium sp. Leaf288]MDT0143290.1 sugar ABC transporter permease [Microbacterium sp. PRC9]
MSTTKSVDGRSAETSAVITLERRAKRARRSRRSSTRFVLAPLSFIAVAVVLFGLFFLWPGALGLWYSFTDYSGVGTPDFIGAENYIELAQDPVFYSVLGRTFLYTILSVPLHFAAALGIAMLLTSSLAKGKSAARIIFFLPWLISPIVAGVIWKWLFGENFGLVNYLIELMGGNGLQWETDPNLALVLILIVSTWGGTAFNMLLFIAAIRNIPQSYLEAAQLDGANGWQRFRRIILPLLRPTSFMVILLTTIGSMKEFAMVQALNGGGPGTSNMFIVQYIYRTGFERADVGYASAASMVLMVILIIIALIQMRFDKRNDLA